MPKSSGRRAKMKRKVRKSGRRNKHRRQFLIHKAAMERVGLEEPHAHIS